MKCEVMTCCFRAPHTGVHAEHAAAQDAADCFERYNGQPDPPVFVRIPTEDFDRLAEDLMAPAKDSPALRTLANGGYKREGKPDLTIVPEAFVVETAEVLLLGEVKHGRENYLTNPKVTDRELLAAIFRHVLKCVKNIQALDVCPTHLDGIRPVTCEKCTGKKHIACVSAGCAMLLDRWAQRKS